MKPTALSARIHRMIWKTCEEIFSREIFPPIELFHYLVLNYFNILVYECTASVLVSVMIGGGDAGRP